MQFDRSFLRYRMQLAERALDEVAKNRTKLWLQDFQSVPLPHEFSLTRVTYHFYEETGTWTVPTSIFERHFVDENENRALYVYSYNGVC